MRRGLAIAAVALVLPSAAGAAPPKPPLGHKGRWITDASGRVVILHGVNMVYKRAPYLPRAAGFGADDARFLHRHGFNTVRLGVIYEGVEPRAPHGKRADFADRYIRRIKRTERTLGRHRIFSLLDFHQDLYNERFEGEGWPAWAVQDDGLANPKNGFPGNYVSNPALNRAFDHFWANDPGPGDIGLERRYAAAWRHVAARFRAARYVLGYDLMNEPWPGSVYPSCTTPAGCPAFDAAELTPFTKRVIARIRRADRHTLAFYEPLLNFDFGAQTSIGDVGGRHAGFSFHDYCLPGAFGGPTGDACESAEDVPFQNADDRAQQTGDALLLTEFGATDDLATIRRIIKLADQHMVGWQYWHYCTCRDPTTQASGNDQALVKSARKRPRGRNVKRAKLGVLERPYPQAVAGTPTEFLYHPGSKRFELHYSAEAPGGKRLPRRVKTRVYVPRGDYPHGYHAQVGGARVVSPAGARYLVLKRLPSFDAVTLTVGPAGS